MSEPPLPLLPLPRFVARAGPDLALRGRARLEVSRGDAVADLSAPARERIERALARRGGSAPGAGATLPLRLTRRADGEGEAAEAYRLVVGAGAVELAARAPAGFAHGASTLAQLVDLAPVLDGRILLPGVAIVDRPTFARRGAMLDVSRGRVPTMETLGELIELFASWKLNHLQLYTEHVFAYAGHEAVWRDASPLTPAEVRELDGFCAARGIELVPNQNCFGHMHRWLKHARYRPLAEVPEGVKHPFAVDPEPFSLCPLDPGSLALVGELLDQLLPCFASDEVNVGLDETFDLGLGRSRAACAERGVGRVYLDYLRAVHGLAAARGKRVQVWADVLMNHPELVPELPRDVTAMLWGYDAAHPFEREARIVAASGLSFFVCPGTSAWQSFGGRTANMLANVASAVQCGVAHGAEGVLVTDWGDRGHLQPQAVSYAGWARAADLAWNDGPRRSEDELAAQLDAYVFRDASRWLGEGALLLGRVEEVLESGASNGTAPFFLIAMVEEPVPSSRVPRLERNALERARAVLADTRGRLDAARPAASEGELARDELRHAADLIELGLDLGAARLDAGGAVPVGALPGQVRAGLRARFLAAVEDHDRLWERRSRLGGREESARWLTRVAEMLGGEEGCRS
jgi:hypothetical protein